ncbi:hypothetical protein ACP70R_011236 [Stipagrostis hirtigluma subsp. patula]
MPPPSKPSRRAGDDLAGSRSPSRHPSRGRAAADPTAGRSPSSHLPTNQLGQKRKGKPPTSPPPRRKPSPGAGCDGLTAEEVAKVDPDYLHFLRHVRVEGDAYTFVCPSKDGVSPPDIIRYEQPLPGPNGEAPRAAPEDGSREAPIKVDDDSLAEDDSPPGGASPVAGVRSGADVAGFNGGARSGKVPMEVDSPGSSADSAWYDSVPDMDEDYREFFKHTRVVNDEKFVFKKGEFSFKYGAEPSDHNSEAEAAANTDDEEEGEEDAGEDEEEEEDADEEEEKDDEEEDEEEEEDDDEEVEEEEEDDEEVEEEEEDDEEVEEEEDEEVEEWDVEEEEGAPASGEDDLGTEEEDNDVYGKMEAGIGSDLPIVKALAIEGPAQKIKEEDEAISGTGEDGAVNKAIGEGEKESDVMVGSDLPMVPVLEFDGHVRMVKEEMEEDDQPLNKQVTGSPKQKPKPKPLNSEASSSKRHDAMPHNTSTPAELQGTVWPTHIIERPESEFKEKLMKLLSKPFNQEEYDELFAQATKRTPIIRERMTRSRVTSYRWKHELGKSYFDSHPDLADQVEGSSYPNRLALLRGFFFWLEHIGLDGQFRPWRDDHKQYRAVCYYE